MRSFSFSLAVLCSAFVAIFSRAQSPALAPPPPPFAEKIPLHGIHNAQKICDPLFRMAMQHESPESLLANLRDFALCSS